MRMNGEPQEVADFLAEFAARSIQIHHPHYMGHQVCAPAPAAVLAGFAAELLNNGMAIYEMGPAATALERWVIQRTATKLGFPDGDGFLTSGGTLGGGADPLRPDCLHEERAEVDRQGLRRSLRVPR